MKLRDDQRLTVPGEVLSQVLEGEAVLLDLDKGRYYGLNDVGSAAWSRIHEGITVGELRRFLLERYEVEEERLRLDLDTLVRDLADRGLVVVDDAES
ncbi:MAG: PqqD family protein [Polyangiaceae bacterium]